MRKNMRAARAAHTWEQLPDMTFLMTTEPKNTRYLIIFVT